MIDKRKLARNINLVYSRLQAIYILTTQYRLSELIIIDRSVYLRSRFLRERRRRTEKMQDGFEIDASTEIILRERILAGRERRGRRDPVWPIPGTRKRSRVLMRLEIKFCRVRVIHLPPVALLSYSPWLRLFSTPQFIKNHLSRRS